MREINIPKGINSSDPEFLEIDRSLVIIGANGSGKSRFGAQIEKGYIEEVHRIPAQKSLVFPKTFQTTTLEHAEKMFRYGVHVNEWSDSDYAPNKEGHRYKGNLAIQPLDDYEKLLQYLFTLHFESMNNDRKNRTSNETVLEKLKVIWEEVISHKVLNIETNSISVTSKLTNGEKYSASEMSDGERFIFYLIGQVLCAHESAIIIIDEPEMHLHKSIIKYLWDVLEESRTDSIFIYMTHDIDFAASRSRSKKIHLKEFRGPDLFDYQIIPDEVPIPEEIYLSIMGSRKPVIFIEGTSSSIDLKLYSIIFKKFTLITSGSCNKVMEYAKAFKGQKSGHYIESYGLIDRDRRSDDDVNKLKTQGILILALAECENLLLVEPIIKLLASNNNIDVEIAFEKIKELIINDFKENKNNQAVEYTQYKLAKVLNRKLKIDYDISIFNEKVEKFKNEIITVNFYEETLKQFEKIIASNDYDSILAIYNRKKLSKLDGINKTLKIGKGITYSDAAIEAIKNKSKTDDTIIENIKQYIHNTELLHH